MKLTEEQREALREVVRAKLRLWDVSVEAEKLIGVDIDTGSEELETACLTADSVEEVEDLPDEMLLSLLDRRNLEVSE